MDFRASRAMFLSALLASGTSSSRATLRSASPSDAWALRSLALRLPGSSLSTESQSSRQLEQPPSFRRTVARFRRQLMLSALSLSSGLSSSSASSSARSYLRRARPSRSALKCALPRALTASTRSTRLRRCASSAPNAPRRRVSSSSLSSSREASSKVPTRSTFRRPGGASSRWKPYFAAMRTSQTSRQRMALKIASTPSQRGAPVSVARSSSRRQPATRPSRRASPGMASAHSSSVSRTAP
mmetsp:Transcript_7299/g.21570  ORF Transcript_7299/g.21570 Transcript_7299/m.21570 type:complete len:242 (+) Transcript_7299:403-1128(+)